MLLYSGVAVHKSGRREKYDGTGGKFYQEFQVAENDVTAPLGVERPASVNGTPAKGKIGAICVLNRVHLRAQVESGCGKDTVGKRALQMGVMVEHFVHINSVVFPHVRGEPSECTFKKERQKEQSKRQWHILLMKPTRRTMFGFLIILDTVQKSRRSIFKFPGSCSVVNIAVLDALHTRQTHRSAVAKRKTNIDTLEFPSAVEAFGTVIFPGKIFALLAKTTMSNRLCLDERIIYSLHNFWPIRVVHWPSSHHHEETSLSVLQSFWFPIEHTGQQLE